MSDTPIQNEQDLWDMLSASAPAESKNAKADPTSDPKGAKPEPVKGSRKIDGFFLGCMAGVAAVSVAATLVFSGIAGGEKTPSPTETNPPVVSTAPDEVVIGIDAAALAQENAELRQQVELQKQQIRDLRAELLDLTGNVPEPTTGTVEPGQTDPPMDAQAEAYDIFHRIQEAYADFDRAALEELIPRMDKLLNYLSSDALNEYYLILEYVEQPSNG